MAQVIQALAALVVEIFLACFCSALLPPCPEPNQDPRVPLATIRVRRRDCTILSICNWTPLRRFVVTFPNLGYWLGILPFHQALRDLLHALCCAELPLRPGSTDQPGVPGVRERATARLNPTPRILENQAFAAMTFDAARRGTAPLDPGAFVGSVLGLELAPEAAGLSGLERSNLPQFLLLNQVLRPLALNALPPEAMTVATRLVGEPIGAAEVAGAVAEMDAVRARMTALEAVLEAQNRDLRAMRERLGWG
jgi:hypothetical protein